MNDVINCILSRRSVKAYSSRPVEEEKLEKILLAGTYAANGRGMQSPKILVLQDPADVRLLERMNAAVLGNENARPFYGAQTVCVVLAAADCPTAVEDGALVMGNLMLAAHSLGVSSCWVHRAREEFASEAGKALLKKWGVEGDWIGVGHCLLGYAAAAPREAAPRKADYIVRV
ncbi:MAG: nitroreductase family protein [Faecousia sp.]